MKKLLNIALIGVLLISSVGQVSAMEGPLDGNTSLEKSFIQKMQDNPRYTLGVIATAFGALGLGLYARTQNWFGWGKVAQEPVKQELIKEDNSIQFTAEIESLTQRVNESNALDALNSLKKDLEIFLEETKRQGLYDLEQRVLVLQIGVNEKINVRQQLDEIKNDFEVLQENKDNISEESYLEGLVDLLGRSNGLLQEAEKYSDLEKEVIDLIGKINNFLSKEQEEGQVEAGGIPEVREIGKVPEVIEQTEDPIAPITPGIESITPEIQQIATISALEAGRRDSLDTLKQTLDKLKNNASPYVYVCKYEREGFVAQRMVDFVIIRSSGNPTTLKNAIVNEFENKSIIEQTEYLGPINLLINDYINQTGNDVLLRYVIVQEDVDSENIWGVIKNSIEGYNQITKKDSMQPIQKLAFLIGVNPLGCEIVKKHFLDADTEKLSIYYMPSAQTTVLWQAKTDILSEIVPDSNLATKPGSVYVVRNTPTSSVGKNIYQNTIASESYIFQQKEQSNDLIAFSRFSNENFEKLFNLGFWKVFNDVRSLPAYYYFYNIAYDGVSDYKDPQVATYNRVNKSGRTNKNQKETTTNEFNKNKENVDGWFKGFSSNDPTEFGLISTEEKVAVISDENFNLIGSNGMKDTRFGYAKIHYEGTQGDARNILIVDEQRGATNTYWEQIKEDLNKPLHERELTAWIPDLVTKIRRDEQQYMPVNVYYVVINTIPYDQAQNKVVFVKDLKERILELEIPKLVDYLIGINGDGKPGFAYGYYLNEFASKLVTSLLQGESNLSSDEIVIIEKVQKRSFEIVNSYKNINANNLTVIMYSFTPDIEGIYPRKAVQYTRRNNTYEKQLLYPISLSVNEITSLTLDQFNIVIRKGLGKLLEWRDEYCQPFNSRTQPFYKLHLNISDITHLNPEINISGYATLDEYGVFNKIDVPQQ